MKPGIVGDDIDKTAFYGSGVLVRDMGSLTRHLADVFSENYILPIRTAEPLQQLDLTSHCARRRPNADRNRALEFQSFP
jgi:hypothetical protein